MTRLFTSAFMTGQRDRWSWTLLSVIPDWVDIDAIVAARDSSLVKDPSVPIVSIREIEEGLCLQMLHIGTCASETRHLARLHNELMPYQGLTFAGPHHEICLSDMRRTQPDRLRTILRQPVKPT